MSGKSRWGNALFWVLLTGVAVGAGNGCASDKSTLADAQKFDSGLKPAELTQQEVQQYFAQLGARVVAAAREADAQKVGPSSHFKGSESDKWMFSNDIQFHLVNSKTPNAFTTGGEHVYVYNELFQMCKTEDELAAVMSHEFGHIYCRHVQKGANRQIAMMGVAGVGAAAGYLYGGQEHGSDYASYGLTAGEGIAQFANLGFTRGDEAQADELGFWFYTHAGWDPPQFPGIFKTMIAAGYDTSSALTSDHPTLASRVDIANKRVKALPASASAWRKANIATPARFDQIKSTAAAAAKTSPDDTSLQNTQQLLAALPRSCWTPQEPADQKAAQQGILDKLKKLQSSQQK